MADNGGYGWDDDTPPAVSIGHPGNRDMCIAYGNYAVESREHTKRIRQLYLELASFRHPAPQLHRERMLVEEERHHEANQKQLEMLRLAVRKEG